MKELTLVKIHSNVENAIMPASENTALFYTSGLTATRDTSNVRPAILSSELSRDWKATL